MYLPKLDFSDSSWITNQLLEFIDGAEVAIFERGMSLDCSIANFYSWCIENKVQVQPVYLVDKLPTEYIMEIIKPNMVIAFMTTGSKREFLNSMTDLLSTLASHRIKVIECYIYEPRIHYIPEKCAHIQAMSLYCYQEEVKEWMYKMLEVK